SVRIMLVSVSLRSRRSIQREYHAGVITSLTRSLRVAAAAAFILAMSSTDAIAWGCEGHRAVVFIAERLLPPTTLLSIRATLAASPVDAALKRFCDAVPDDPIADNATWADDYRDVEPMTAGWHFIDVPRDSAFTSTNAHKYCPGGDCALHAIA